MTGTNLSATNKVTDVFASADAAPLASGGSWGTTLGEITANAGSLNFAATPSGTGQSARAIQIRGDLEGGSNASPHIEGININMRTQWPVKYIREFPLLFEPQGSVQPWDKLLTDLEAILAAATDTNVTYGEETTAIPMEPWRYGEGPIKYNYKVQQSGTVNAQISEITGVSLVMVDV